VERLDCWKEEGVISRADDKHRAKRLSLDFEGHPMQPEWAPTTSANPGRENAFCPTLKPSTRVYERQDFGNELLRTRTARRPRGSTRQSLGVFGDQLPEMTNKV
jgi:hypothetical protein